MKKILFLFFYCIYFQSFGQVIRVEGKCVGKNNIPLENVLIKTKEKVVQTTYSDSLGFYSFTINYLDTLVLVFSIGEFKETRRIKLKFGETIQVETIAFPILQQIGVSVVKTKNHTIWI